MKETFNQNQSESATLERFRTLVSDVRHLRPDGTVSFISLPLLTDAEALERSLKAQSVGRIMLGDGESFGIDDPSGYYPPLDLRAGEVAPGSASVTAWSWQYPDGSSACQLDTVLWYRKGDEQAAQRIELYASNASPMPRVMRMLSSMEYAETGYEGHGEAFLDTQVEEDVVAVLDVVEPHIRRVVGMVLEKMASKASGN